jgi:hypothetical protein
MSEGERGVRCQVEIEWEELRERMENQTLSLSIYSPSGISGWVGLVFFFEAGLIVCPPPKIDLWNRLFFEVVVLRRPPP